MIAILEVQVIIIYDFFENFNLVLIDYFLDKIKKIIIRYPQKNYFSLYIYTVCMYIQVFGKGLKLEVNAMNQEIQYSVVNEKLLCAAGNQIYPL